VRILKDDKSLHLKEKFEEKYYFEGKFCYGKREHKSLYVIFRKRRVLFSDKMYRGWTT
jgi:hypothetical protein